MLSEETVKKLAAVCRLTLSPQEIAQYQRDLEALEKLSAPLLCDFVPSDREQGRSVRLSELREDRVGAAYPRDVMLTAAPDREDGYILVPRAVEDPE